MARSKAVVMAATTAIRTATTAATASTAVSGVLAAWAAIQHVRTKRPTSAFSSNDETAPVRRCG